MPQELDLTPPERNRVRFGRRSFFMLASGLLVPYEPARAYSFLWAPQHFGGLGGCWGGRPYDPTDLFEAAVMKRLGSQLAAEGDGQRIEGDWYKKGIGSELWSAIANQGWRHAAGHTASYSFRAAGDLIAAVRGVGQYTDWYCSGSYATVSERVRDAMKIEGWEPVSELTDGELGYA